MKSSDHQADHGDISTALYFSCGFDIYKKFNDDPYQEFISGFIKILHVGYTVTNDEP